MSLLNLAVEEMVHVSSFWLSDEQTRAILEQTSVLKPLVPTLQAVHDELLAVQPPEQDPAVSALVEAASAADAEHDRVLRGIYMLLTSLSLLESDKAEARLALRDRLMGEGPQLTQRSYESQAGYVQILDKRLEQRPEPDLDAIVINGVPLHSYVTQWIAAGQRLGGIEAERASRLAPETAITAGRVHGARLDWVRICNALQNMLAFAEIDPKQRERILGTLRDVERLGDERAARKATAKGNAQAAEAPSQPVTEQA